MNTPGKAVVFLAVYATSAFAATTVAQSAAPSALGTDDRAQVIVEVTDANGAARVALPPSDDFDVLGRSSSSRTSVQDDGSGAPAVTRSQRFVFTVKPRRAGALQVPAATVEVDGERLAGAAVQLQVSPGHVAATAPPEDTSDPFARLFGGDPFGDTLLDRFFDRGARTAAPLDARLLVTLDKPEVYAGQQATLSVYLATRSPVSSVNGLRMPSIDGAASQELDTPKRPEPRPMTVDGKEYQAFLLARRALFPSKAGRLVIPAASLSVAAGGAFDLPRERTLTSASRTLEVSPLPAGGRPGEPVGRWRVSTRVGARVTPTVGQPLPVQVTLEGTGDLLALPEPELSLSGSARVLAPTVADAPTVEGGRLGGRRTYEFLVTPDVQGPLTVSALPLPYFDPVTARHETATAAPLILDVMPGSPVAVSSNATAAPAPVAAQQAPPPLQTIGLVVAATLVVGAAALLVLRVRDIRRGKAPSAREQRRAATRKLDGARKAALAGNASDAVRLTEQALATAGAAAGLDPGRVDVDRLAADETRPFGAAWAQALLRCRRARYLALDPDAVSEVLANAASALDQLASELARPRRTSTHAP